jgi:hypothetical protein
MRQWPDDALLEFVKVDSRLADRFRQALKEMPLSKAIPTRDEGYTVVFQGDLESILRSAMDAIEADIRDNREFAVEVSPDAPLKYKYSLSRMTGRPGNPDSRKYDLDVVGIFLGKRGEGRMLYSVYTIARIGEDLFVAIDGADDENEMPEK